MNALQPLAPLPSRRLTPRRRRHRQPHSHKGIAAEIAMKLVVNGILSATAIVTLAKLLPYQLIQQEKLQEVRLEVQETEARVDRLRENFSRNFDPSQTRNVMQEQSSRVAPGQRRIFLLPSIVK
jgi:hypothetical protein